MNALQSPPQEEGKQSVTTAVHYKQQILETSSIGVLITRIGVGTILYANKAIADLLGIAGAASLIGTPVPNFYWDQEDRRKLLERFQHEGSITSSETRACRADGSMLWVSISIQPFTFEGEQVLLSEITDINALKQAEEALQASEKQFHTLYDNAMIGLYRTTPDGHILMINPTGLRLMGFDSFEEFAKRNLEEAGFEEKDARKDFREKLERDGVIDLESIWTKKDGTSIIVREGATIFRDENGKVLYYDGSFEDITAHKRAEEALRENQQFLQLMMDNIPQSIFWKDSQLNYLGCNRSFAAVVGFASPDDVIGKDDFDLPSKDRAEMYRADDRLVMESGIPRLNFEELQTRADGSTHWLSTSKIPIRDVDGKVIAMLGLFQDITERKQVEESLHTSEERFRRFTEATSEGLVFHEQGGIVDVNPAAVTLFGFSSTAELIGKNLLEFIVPESRELVLNKMQSETVLPYEIQGIHNDGSTFPIETSTRAYKVGDNIIRASSIKDITERKQADQALRENQRLLQLVMDNIPQAVFWKDKNLTYMGANQAFAEDAGLNSGQDLVGKHDFDMPWKEQAELYRADDQRVLDIGETKLNYEEQQTGPTGQITWVRTNKIPMRDANGQIFAVLGMYEDITERKNMEKQIQTVFERRGYQVQISTEISQEIAAASEIGDLFSRVVTLTKERLGYYHTQLLRYDATQDAVVLISGYGETGKKMLAEGHQMPLGSGLIGTAAASGETILRSTLTEDLDWQPNPLLPDTKGEIAVPIKLGEQVLGVLDVQSNQIGALTEDDRLLLEGLCGQIAVAMEQTRLRQEMAERLEEINRLYRNMSHQGWKTYRETADLPTGFMFDQTGTKPVDNAVLADELFANIPMKVMGGEVVGMLSVANDPRNPTSPEDQAFLQQVSEQIALALEGARLTAQTQSALAQTEKLSEAGLLFTRATDLQELVKIAVETLGIPAINRAALETLNYNSANEVESMDIVANWWSGTGHEPTTIGTHYTAESLPILQLFLSPTPLFVRDAFQDERVDGVTLEIIKRLNIHAFAILPLYLGTQQIGALVLEAEEPYGFNQDETRLLSAMGPQISTVLENRRQFEKAQKQAERESTLNLISQKIQSATTVEAVLQIAARELGHALGAPMTIAQLSMKDKK